MNDIMDNEMRLGTTEFEFNRVFQEESMKKTLIVTGECILLIVILVIIKLIIKGSNPELANNDIVSFVFYCIAGIGSVLIYRLNAKGK